MDSTIIVTACKQTKKDNLRRAIQNIQNVGGKIAGVVVNKVPTAAKKYEQSYYYGSTEMSKARSDMRKAMKNNLRTQSQSNANAQKRTQNASSRINNNLNRVEHTNSRLENRNQNQNIDKDNLQRNIKVNTSSEISLEKTNDILKQINEYIDNEKKNLK